MTQYHYPLGKLPAKPEQVSFEFATYVNTTKLPTLPAVIGHQQLLPIDAGMLGNDQYGDCVWAGAAHETMLWNEEAGKEVVFSRSSVLSDYSAVTGFNPNEPDSDKGTDMSVAAKYRRQTGVVDSTGARHKVDAYLKLNIKTTTQLKQALYLFGAVGIGIQFPDSAMTQFNNGKPWTVVKGAQIEGGHYVPLVGFNKKFYVVTWGRLQPVTAGFLTKYADEAIAYVSLEALAASGKSLEGFDKAQLEADLKAL